MESVTYLKNIKITPKKLRFLVPTVKQYKPRAAANHLYYMTNKNAKVLYKAVQSAISNATQSLKVNEDLLQFKVFTIEEGQKLKRYNAGSRGMAKPYVRRFAHIKIILTAPGVTQPAVKTAKKEEKKAEPKAEVGQVWEAEAEAKPKAAAKAPAKKTVKKAAPKKKVTNTK